jgi:hypothetical protein
MNENNRFKCIFHQCYGASGNFSTSVVIRTTKEDSLPEVYIVEVDDLDWMYWDIQIIGNNNYRRGVLERKENPKNKDLTKIQKQIIKAVIEFNSESIPEIYENLEKNFSLKYTIRNGADYFLKNLLGDTIKNKKNKSDDKKNERKRKTDGFR